MLIACQVNSRQTREWEPKFDHTIYVVRVKGPVYHEEAVWGGSTVSIAYRLKEALLYAFMLMHHWVQSTSGNHEAERLCRQVNETEMRMDVKRVEHRR